MVSTIDSHAQLIFSETMMTAEARCKRMKELFELKNSGSIDPQDLKELFQSLMAVAAIGDGDESKDENIDYVDDLAEIENWLGICHLDGVGCEK